MNSERQIIFPMSATGCFVESQEYGSVNREVKNEGKEGHTGYSAVKRYIISFDVNHSCYSAAQLAIIHYTIE